MEWFNTDGITGHCGKIYWRTWPQDSFQKGTICQFGQYRIGEGAGQTFAFVFSHIAIGRSEACWSYKAFQHSQNSQKREIIWAKKLSAFERNLPFTPEGF